MANRRNVSSNRDDILEQWLNAEVDSDEDEIGRNSPFRNNVPTRTTNSENEFSDDQEEFVITSDHDSNSEMSEGLKTVHLCPKCRLPICMTCAKTVCNSCL